MTCLACDGKGKVVIWVQDFSKPSADRWKMEVKLCNHCNGTGRMTSD